jgi:hypothetical protein
MRIALIGNSKSGKSTLACHLVDKFDFKRYSFADRLKLFSAYPVKDLTKTTKSVEEIYEEVFKDPMSPYKDTKNVEYEGMTFPNGMRGFAQGCGSAARDLIGVDTWVNALLKLIEEENAERIVIDDVRFENEAHALADQGFELIFLNYPGTDTDVVSEQCQALAKELPSGWIDLQLDRTDKLEHNIGVLEAFINRYYEE